MFSSVQDVTNTWALRFGRVLPFQQLPESENRVERRAQFVTDTRKEFTFGFVCPLYLLNALPLRYILNSALVIQDRPGRIPDGAGVFAEPNLAAILAIDLILKQLHKSVDLNQALKLIPAHGIHIYDPADIAHAFHELFG